MTMGAAPRRRGAALLLAHCSAIDRLTADREPARVRLEEAVGPDFARRLVAAIVAGRRAMQAP
jgi:hypothetical protein